MFIPPHDPDFVPEPIYLEYIPLEDEHILPAEEQPLPPIAESPGYVVESDPEEDPEEYKDDETEDDDTDDEDKDEEDEEEEEHLALADSTVVIPADELVSLPKRTEPAAISFPPEVEVERLLAMPAPSPSPLTSLSPPSAGERLARCMAPVALPYDVRESSTARLTRGQGIDYGFVSTLDAEARRRGIGEDKLLALREQPRRGGQPGGDAGVLNHQDAPRDADSHI
nr:hypothetical protein [Tanacetum cinerariifolium]